MTGTRPRVLSVGPDPEGRGGMVAVTHLMIRHCTEVADLTVVRTHVDGSAARRVATWVAGTAKVLRRLARREVDVLHLHVSRRGSILRKVTLVPAARLFRVPLVLHCHAGQFSDEFRAMPRPLRGLVAAAFRQADLLLVLGARWRSDYVELIGIPPERVVVVTNPVEAPAELPARPASPVRLAYLGRYQEGKGTYDLLRAVATLPPQVRAACRLSMAGDGDVATARALVRELALEDAVEVAGWLGPAERDAALAAASVFVLPSYHEGLPMAMLEAMAWGLVPVVSPVGGIPEIVTNDANGLIVTPGDVPGIAAALERVVTDQQVRSRLSAAARRTAAEHGIEPFVESLARAWRSTARREAVNTGS